MREPFEPRPVTEVKLTFSLPLALVKQMVRVRQIVDLLLEGLGLTAWRWEFKNGAITEVIRGPYRHDPPQVFDVPFDVPTEAETIQRLHLDNSAPTCRRGTNGCERVGAHTLCGKYFADGSLLRILE